MLHYGSRNQENKRNKFAYIKFILDMCALFSGLPSCKISCFLCFLCICVYATSFLMNKRFIYCCVCMFFLHIFFILCIYLSAVFHHTV